MKASLTAIVLTGTLLGGGIACADGGHAELTETDQTIGWAGVVWGTSSPDEPTTRTGCQNLPTAVAQAGASSFAGKVCDGFDLDINLPGNVWKTGAPY